MTSGTWITIILGTLLLTLSAASSPKVRAKFQCEVSYQARNHDGALAETKIERVWKERYSRFTFDEGTGAFDWKQLDLRINYDVVQFGSTVNSVMAVAKLQGPASYSVKVLRIENWNPVRRSAVLLFPFVLLDEDTVMSGYCRYY